MNHNYYGYGNGGYVSGLLTLGFIIMVAFFVGLLLVLAGSGRAKIWGWYCIVIAILLAIIELIIYSGTRHDL